MKKLASLLFLSLAFHAQPLFAAEHTTDSVTPERSLQKLLDGNKKFAKLGVVKNLEKAVSVKRRVELAKGQKPYAVIIACSDSRVSPEILFDKGLGEIFVVRVAGNIVGPHELGSVEYAVEHLGVRLVLVLGHERCGAVTAAYDAHIAGSKVEGNIGTIIEAIDPAVTTVLSRGIKGDKADLVDQCINENVRLVAAQVESRSPILREAVEKGHIKIVKACYDLDEGKFDGDEGWVNLIP
ncbi:MAG: carbonic anhydrase [Chlorobium sp.]